MPQNNKFLTDNLFFVPCIKNKFFKALEFYDNLYAVMEENAKENTTPKVNYPIYDVNFKQKILNSINTNDFPPEFKEKIDILVHTTSNNNLILCNKNIGNVSLKKEYFNMLQMLFKKNKYIGKYNFGQNKIIYYNHYIDIVLGHEILHMASTIKHKKCYSSGFRYALFLTD